MTITNENGKSSFREVYVTRNGLVTEKPTPDQCFSDREAESMADAILNLLGMGREK